MEWRAGKRWGAPAGGTAGAGAGAGAGGMPAEAVDAGEGSLALGRRQQWDGRARRARCGRRSGRSRRMTRAGSRSTSTARRGSRRRRHRECFFFSCPTRASAGGERASSPRSFACCLRWLWLGVAACRAALAAADGAPDCAQGPELPIPGRPDGDGIHGPSESEALPRRLRSTDSCVCLPPLAVYRKLTRG